MSWILNAVGFTAGAATSSAAAYIGYKLGFRRGHRAMVEELEQARLARLMNNRPVPRRDGSPVAAVHQARFGGVTKEQ